MGRENSGKLNFFRRNEKASNEQISNQMVVRFDLIGIKPLEEYENKNIT